MAMNINEMHYEAKLKNVLKNVFTMPLSELLSTPIGNLQKKLAREPFYCQVTGKKLAGGGYYSGITWRAYFTPKIAIEDTEKYLAERGINSIEGDPYRFCTEDGLELLRKNFILIENNNSYKPKN